MFLHTTNSLSEKEVKKTSSSIIALKIKCLEINVTNKLKETF
jgi:hypothetical protein